MNIEKKANIIKYLELSGFKDNYEPLISNAIAGLAANPPPSISPKSWGQMLHIMREKYISKYSELYDVTVGLFDEYYNDMEMAALVQFAESDAGRSIINKLPTVMTSVSKRGSMIGEQVAQETWDEYISNKDEN